MSNVETLYQLIDASGLTNVRCLPAPVSFSHATRVVRELPDVLHRQHLPKEPEQRVKIGIRTGGDDVILAHTLHNIDLSGVALVPQSGHASVFPKFAGALLFQFCTGGGQVDSGGGLGSGH